MLYPNFKKKRKLRISQAREVLNNLEHLVPRGNQVLEGCTPYAGCIGIIIYSTFLIFFEGVIVITLWEFYRDITTENWDFYDVVVNIVALSFFLAILVSIASYLLKDLRIFSLGYNYNAHVWNTYLKMLDEGEIIEGTVAYFSEDKKHRHIEYVFTSPAGQKIHWKYTTCKRESLKEGDSISVLYLDDDTYSLI